MTLDPIRRGTKLDLADVDPRGTPGFDGHKAEALPVFAALQSRLAQLQDVLYAQGSHRVLVVLQGMDTSGKDGTIRHVFHEIDPIGVRIQSFKAPSAQDLAHDYLWRVHPHVPGDGELVVFNRSHYEDVLITRVHGWIDDRRATTRLAHLRAFEQLLVDEGTTVVKLFLHISKAEQAARLQARLDEPTKRWKFARADLDEREHWDRYQELYAQAIAATSTEQAPWFVVPADRKWFRNLAVAQILVDSLERLDLRYPEPEEGLVDVTVT